MDKMIHSLVLFAVFGIFLSVSMAKKKDERECEGTVESK